MKGLAGHPLYRNDLRAIATAPFIPWEKLQDSSLFISGATGQIGSCLIEAIMLRNQEYDLNCTVFALSRNREKALSRFSGWRNCPFLQIVEGDVNAGIP